MTQSIKKNKKSSNSEINPGFHGERRNTLKAGWPWCAWCWQFTLSPFRHFVSGAWESQGGKSAPGRIIWMISWLSSVPHYWEWWGSGVGLQLSWKAVYSFKVIDLLLSATYSKQVRRIHSYDIIFLFMPVYFCFYRFIYPVCRMQPWAWTHVWSDTSLAKCKNKEQNHLKPVKIMDILIEVAFSTTCKEPENTNSTIALLPVSLCPIKSHILWKHIKPLPTPRQISFFFSTATNS